MTAGRPVSQIRRKFSEETVSSAQIQSQKAAGTVFMAHSHVKDTCGQELRQLNSDLPAGPPAEVLDGPRRTPRELRNRDSENKKRTLSFWPCWFTLQMT